jgi:hypothetical protein
MDSITIGFSKPKTWKPFAWLIMQGYGTPYAHVYIKFHSESYDRDLVYQASGLAVNFMNKQHFQEHNTVVQEFQIAISEEDKKAMVQFAIDSIGSPYGMKDCLGLAWVRFCEIFGKKVKNPFDDGMKMWVCCELGYYVWKTYVKKEQAVDAGDITPKSLYNQLNVKGSQ